MTTTVDIREYFLNRGLVIGYFEAIKELVRKGYDIDEVTEVVRTETLLFNLLQMECNKNRMLRANRKKSLF